ncbi:hypothetical protein C8R44DRAFT_34686 [Mycena epipterygia]|nr:hypothetical protein C8R44DRAFT_34686 [Mycena epipterygia]
MSRIGRSLYLAWTVLLAFRSNSQTMPLRTGALLILPKERRDMFSSTPLSTLSRPGVGIAGMEDFRETIPPRRYVERCWICRVRQSRVSRHKPHPSARRRRSATQAHDKLCPEGPRCAFGEPGRVTSQPGRRTGPVECRNPRGPLRHDKW